MNLKRNPKMQNFLELQNIHKTHANVLKKSLNFNRKGRTIDKLPMGRTNQGGGNLGGVKTSIVNWPKRFSHEHRERVYQYIL